MGQDTNDTSPILKFYDANGNELYNLGPDGILQNDATYAPPKFTAVRFWHFSSLAEYDKIVAITDEQAKRDYGADAKFSDGPLYWYKYEDAKKVIWLDSTSSVVQYQNPDTGQYSSSMSKYYNNYFMTGNFGLTGASDGYYVLDPILWNGDPSGRATLLRLVTENGVRKYYVGSIEYKQRDQNSGISCVIDYINLTLFE
jgi:hypothetical protein